jgi:PAS domain S-box-containing protein
MNYPLFDKQLEETRLRLHAIQTQSVAVAEPHLLLPQALEEVSQSLEELRVAEEELHAQNEELLAGRQLVEAERRRYRELFEFGLAAYLVTDAMGNIQEANHAAGRLLGVSPSFLMNKPLIVFVAEEAHDDYRRLVADIRAGQQVDRELPIQPSHGSKLPAEVHVGAGRTSQGFFLLRWMIRDLNELKRTNNTPRNGETPLPKEQLSAIGRMLAGLADTSRDALERSQACLEKLALEVQDRPQALQCLAEFQKAQEELRQLHGCISEYAAPVLLQQREMPDLIPNPKSLMANP